MRVKLYDVCCRVTYSVSTVTVVEMLSTNQVEHIVRDDYLVEAMECLELYCDLVLARIGLIETQK